MLSSNGYWLELTQTGCFLTVRRTERLFRIAEAHEMPMELRQNAEIIATDRTPANITSRRDRPKSQQRHCEQQCSHKI